MATTGDRRIIPAGTQVEFTNLPRDAPSFTVEGLAGLAFSNGLMKINFYEQFMENESAGNLVGRYNLILNMPVDQFLLIEAVFRKIAEDIVNQSAEAHDAPAEAN